MQSQRANENLTQLACVYRSTERLSMGIGVSIAAAAATGVGRDSGSSRRSSASLQQPREQQQQQQNRLYSRERRKIVVVNLMLDLAYQFKRLVIESRHCCNRCLRGGFRGSLTRRHSPHLISSDPRRDLSSWRATPRGLMRVVRLWPTNTDDDDDDYHRNSKYQTSEPKTGANNMSSAI